MIHTAEFSIQLDYEHINFRKDHYGKEPISEILHRHMMKGISSVEYSNNFNASCKMVIDIPLILNKGDVEESDYEQVERYIKGALSIVYGDEQLFEQHNLSRVDYRFDIEVPDRNIRKVYFELFRKLKKKLTWKKGFVLLHNITNVKAFILSSMIRNKSVEIKMNMLKCGKEG